MSSIQCWPILFFADQAVYATTSRGRIQLIYCGQPFIFEKTLKLETGEEKKYWRCNQWWNQKCRSRVYTVNNVITPLNSQHTHVDIVRRKKRVRKQKNIVEENLEVENIPAYELVPHDELESECDIPIKYEIIVGIK